MPYANFFLLIWAAILFHPSRGQSTESSYGFAHHSGNYQPLEAPLVLNPGVDFLGHDAYTVPLGFAFDFFGRPLHSVEVQRRGLVFFGNENEFAAPFRPVLAITPHSQVGYQVDTDGPCAQKIMKVEWKRMGVLGPDSTLGEVSLQLWLYEGSHRLEWHYGPRSSFSEGANFQVDGYSVYGPRLRIRRNEQIAVVVGSYAAPELEQNSDSLSTFSEELLMGIPPEGTVYRFTPQATLQAPGFRLGPNPTTGILYLRLQAPDCQPYRLTLFDLLGRVYLRAESRRHELPLDLSGFQPGRYFLRVSYPDGRPSQVFKLRLVE